MKSLAFCFLAMALAICVTEPAKSQDNKSKFIINKSINVAPEQSGLAPQVDLGAKALTMQECLKLGGVPSPIRGCANFGSIACVTTDQSGKAHAVCINETLAPKDNDKKTSERKKPGRFEQSAPTVDLVVAPLTQQECKGLGGTVESTNKCNAAGQKACRTIDKHGVIRVACIDEVAK